MTADRSYFNDLQQWIFEEKKIVTYRYLSTKFQVGSNVAKQMLYDFSQAHPQVDVLFLLSGRNKKTKNHIISIIPKTQLEEAKSSLDPIISLHIYSVQLTTPKDSASIALVDRDLWTEIDQKNAEYHSKNEGNPFIDHRFSSLDNVPQEPKLVLSHKETNIIDLTTPSTEPNQKSEFIRKTPKLPDSNHIQQKEVSEKQMTSTELNNKNTKGPPSKIISPSIISLFAGCTSQKSKQTLVESPNESQQESSIGKEHNEMLEPELQFEQLQPKQLKRLRTSVEEQTHTDTGDLNKKQKTESNESNFSSKEKISSSSLRDGSKNSVEHSYKEGIVELFRKQQKKVTCNTQSIEKKFENERNQTKEKENLSIQSDKPQSQQITTTKNHSKESKIEKRNETLKKDLTSKQTNSEVHSKAKKTIMTTETTTTTPKRKRRAVQLNDNDVERPTSESSNNSSSSSSSSSQESSESRGDSSESSDNNSLSSSESSSSKSESDKETETQQKTKKSKSASTKRKKHHELHDETKNKSNQTTTIEDLLKKMKSEKNNETNQKLTNSSSLTSSSTLPNSNIAVKQTPTIKQKVIVEETYFDERNFKRHRTVTKLVDVPVKENSQETPESQSSSSSTQNKTHSQHSQSDSPAKQSDIKTFFRITKK